MPLLVRDAGTWKQGTVYVRDGGTWKVGIMSVRDAGTWKVGSGAADPDPLNWTDISFSTPFEALAIGQNTNQQTATGVSTTIDLRVGISNINIDGTNTLRIYRSRGGGPFTQVNTASVLINNPNVMVVTAQNNDIYYFRAEVSFPAPSSFITSYRVTVYNNGSGNSLDFFDVTITAGV